ncbi:MAG: hypothetical protein WDM79_16595 [Terricaulis sp.]
MRASAKSPCSNKPFTVAEAKEAREAFITSASNIAIPVLSIDGATIGEGRPGPLSRTLRDAYFGAADAQA